MVRKILSEKDVQETEVCTSLTSPEDVLDAAGKGVGRTSGVAMLEVTWEEKVDEKIVRLRSGSVGFSTVV